MTLHGPFSPRTASSAEAVPTTFVEPGEAWSFEGLGEFVVKPTVSCGSRDTMRYALPGSGDAPDAHVRRLLDEGRSVMLQPYLEAVDTVGESALIFIDGAYSHSIRKGQMLHRDRSGAKVVGLYVEEQIDPRTAGGVNHVRSRVQCDPHRAHGAARISDLQTDIVPGFGQGRGRQALQNANDVGQQQLHGKPHTQPCSFKALLASSAPR